MFTLMKQEWKKIFRMKAVPLLLFIVFLISVISFGAELLYQDEYSPQEYLNLHKTIDKQNLEGELNRLEEASYVMLLEQVLPEHSLTDSIGKEYELYQQLIQEIKQVEGYDSYLSGVQKNAEKKLNSTLYQKQTSTLREVDKVRKDFGAMQGTQAELLPTKGVDVFLEQDLLDFLLVIVVFLVAAALISLELEEGTIGLLRCTVMGRLKVVYAKFLAGSLVLVLFFGVLIGVRFGLVAAVYGTECLSGSIVSLNGGMACTLPVTIAQGILLFIGLKLLAVLSLFSVVLLFAILLQQPWRVYIFAGGLVALLWLAYVTVDENSWLANVKWINPVAFFDTKMLLLQYKNIMLFGYPVTYRTCMLVVSLLLACCSLLLLGKTFLGILPGKRFGATEKGYAVLECVISKLTGGHSLGGFELRKWSFYQSGGIILLILVAGMFFTYSPVKDQIYTEEEIYYRYYVKKVEGVWSEDKMTFLYEEQKQLEEYRNILESGTELDSVVASYYRQQLKKEAGLRKVVQYGEFLREKGKGTFIYEQGYERLFGQREPMQLFLYRCVSVAVTVFLSTLLYGMDSRTGMNQLIQISAVGQRKVRMHKRWNNLLIGMVVFSVVFLPWFYNVFSVYGTNGVEAPAYCLVTLGLGRKTPAGVTVGVLLAGYYGVQLLYLWVTGFVSGMVAKKIQNPLVASLASFGTSFLPLLLLGMN